MSLASPRHPLPKSNLQSFSKLSIPSGRLADDDLALADTPFREYVDYATWTQYLAKQLVATGDVARLSSAINRLQALNSRLRGADAVSGTQAIKRLTQDLYELRIRSASHHMKFDPKAEEVYDLIEHGHYNIAKEMLRNILHQMDYIKLSASLKNVVILEGLIQYDGLNPKAVLSIWENMWNLSQDDKVSALIRAKQLCSATRSAVADPHHQKGYRCISRTNNIDARVLVNLGQDVTKQLGEPYIRDDPVEHRLLQMGMAYMNTDYCAAQTHIRTALHMATDQLRRKELERIEKRLGEQCVRKQLDSTYRMFCQVGHEAAFPIGEATVTNPVSSVVATAERTFWTRIAIGDCISARSDLEAVRRIVPTNIIHRRDYLISRMEFMESRLRKCQQAPGLYANGFGQRIMALLQNRNYQGAYWVWQQNRNHPTAVVWRTAILVARYPKVIYAPCTGNSLVTGVPNMDRQLFDRLEALMTGRKSSSCVHETDKELCNLIWMRAAYVTGRHRLVHHYARQISRSAKYCDEANQLMACQLLCFSGRGYSEACSSLSNYQSMSQQVRSAPHNAIGLDLATRLCRSSKQIVLDPFYIRNGPTPRPLTFLFRHYFKRFLYDGQRSLFSPKTKIHPSMLASQLNGKNTVPYSSPSINYATQNSQTPQNSQNRPPGFNTITHYDQNMQPITATTAIYGNSHQSSPISALGSNQKLVKGGWDHYMGHQRHLGSYQNINAPQITDQQRRALLQAQELLCPCLAKHKGLMFQCRPGRAGDRCRAAKRRFMQSYQRKNMKKVCSKPKCRIVKTKCKKGDKKCKSTRRVCSKPQCRLIPKHNNKRTSKVCEKPKCKMVKVKCKKGDKKCKSTKRVCSKPKCRSVNAAGNAKTRRVCEKPKCRTVKVKCKKGDKKCKPTKRVCGKPKCRLVPVTGNAGTRRVCEKPKCRTIKVKCKKGDKKCKPTKRVCSKPKCRMIKVKGKKQCKSTKRVCSKPKCKVVKVKCKKDDKKCKPTKRVCSKPKCKMVNAGQSCSTNTAPGSAGSRLFGEKLLGNCDEGVKHAYKAFLKRTGSCDCKPCNSKASEKFLVDSHALEVAAKMFASGQLQCPCLKKSLLKKYGINFDKLQTVNIRKSGNCTCKCTRKNKIDPLKEWRLQKFCERKGIRNGRNCQLYSKKLMEKHMKKLRLRRAKLRATLRARILKTERCRAHYQKLVKAHVQKCRAQEKKRMQAVRAEQQRTILSGGNEGTNCQDSEMWLPQEVPEETSSSEEKDLPQKAM
ncbi:Cell surface protein [Paramicrosporidium saccamoebae]|uniref:Cell surface protein n=1 Tax=Paramicrosporidium saccamoebae TaxID=1246581 RepID=A0A2H9TMK8_9FUNG|nr:Cell surface protein [Paramicrosporidium saccamoebae]